MSWANVWPVWVIINYMYFRRIQLLLTTCHPLIKKEGCKIWKCLMNRKWNSFQNRHAINNKNYLITSNRNVGVKKAGYNFFNMAVAQDCLPFSGNPSASHIALESCKNWLQIWNRFIAEFWKSKRCNNSFLVLNFLFLSTNNNFRSGKYKIFLNFSFF